MKPTSIVTHIWLALLLLASGILVSEYLNSQNTRHAVESSYRKSVKHLVAAGKSILQTYYERERAGMLSRKEAQRRALAAIAAIRYDGGNYIFVGDRHGVSLSNGVTALVGTNILEIQDPEGKPLVRELYRIAAQGGGFVDYQWPVTSDRLQLATKTSYAAYFSPWQWTLGTGLNRLSLQAELQTLQRDSLFRMALIFLFILVLGGVFSHRLRVRTKQIAVAMQQLADGQQTLNTRLPSQGSREFDDIAASYNQLAGSLDQVTQEVWCDRQRLSASLRRLRLNETKAESAEPDERTLPLIPRMVRQVCHQAEILEAACDNLQQRVEQDPDTGLLNRQAFEQTVRERLQALKLETPNMLALLACDLPFQDRETETRMLAAQLLKYQLPADVLICVLPEKGFAVWGCYEDSNEAMRVALTLQQLLQQEPDIGTVSIGLSVMLGAQKNVELLFSEAERALIRAQREGGNCVYEY